MSGNNKKFDRNKPGGAASVGNMRDAVDIETACFAMNLINRRIKREKEKARAAKRTKVTLPVFNIQKKPIDET